MVRRVRWIAALVAMLVAAPAQADITARFAQRGDRQIIVEVRDNGDSRITVNDGVYVSTGGATHMILTDARGTFVARQADFVALMDELMRIMPLQQGAAGDSFAIEERGTETIAGRNGRVLRIGARASRTDAMDVVVSEDSELAPVGRAMATLLAPILVVATQATPGLSDAMTGLLQRGTVLRFGNVFTLASVDTSPVSPRGFILPSAPVSREALRERIMNGATR